MCDSVIPEIGIQAIRPLLDRLRARDIDAATLLSEVGIPDLKLDDPDARLPLKRLDRLWTAAAERACDADLGLHVAETVQSDSFGLLSYLGTASASWGEGLARVLRYFRLLSDASSYHLDVSDGVATITATQDTPPDAPVRQRVEFTISVLYCYARSAIDGDWQVRDVFFEHAPPADLAEHRRLYGQLPRFGAPGAGSRSPPSCSSARCAPATPRSPSCSSGSPLACSPTCRATPRSPRPSASSVSATASSTSSPSTPPPAGSTSALARCSAGCARRARRSSPCSTTPATTSPAGCSPSPASASPRSRSPSGSPSPAPSIAPSSAGPA
jgi:hypothetical protein